MHWSGGVALIRDPSFIDINRCLYLIMITELFFWHPHLRTGPRHWLYHFIHIPSDRPSISTGQLLNWRFSNARMETVAFPQLKFPSRFRWLPFATMATRNAHHPPQGLPPGPLPHNSLTHIIHMNTAGTITPFFKVY